MSEQRTNGTQKVNLIQKILVLSHFLSQSHTTTVLLDVRTKDEWDTEGKPDTKDLGIKSFFITISHDNSFLDNVRQSIDKKDQVLVMCAAGGRSIIAANLLANEGYNTLNVSDGFSGNGQDPGWKSLGLPSIIDN